MAKNKVLGPGDDLQMIRSSDLWPRWPFLPVKRDVSKGVAGKELGILWVGTHKDGTGEITIHHANLWMMPKTVEEFKALPTTTYPSAEAMLADGWVVD